MAGYFDTYPVNFDTKPVACCPLHDEDTPSFRYYEETNSFYCFGCRKGGDVINLHRYFFEAQDGKKPSIEESIDFLYRYFIQGQKQSAPTKIKLRIPNTEEQPSSNTELFRFNKYLSLIEQQLLVDDSISFESKQEIWGIKDEVESLVALKLLNATQGKEYIQSYIIKEIK